MKRKTLLWLALPLLLAAIFLYKWLAPTPPSPFLSKIPAYAEAVVVLDLKQFSQKIGYESLVNPEIFETIKEDSIFKRMLYGGNKAGIDLSQQLALFAYTDSTKRPVMGAYFPLKSAKEFHGFYEEQLRKKYGFYIHEESDFSIIRSDSLKLSIGWNDDYGLLLQQPKFSPAKLKQLTQTPDSSSIMAKASFRDLLELHPDLGIYFPPTTKTIAGRAWFKKIGFISTALFLEDGAINIQWFADVKTERHSKMLGQLLRTGGYTFPTDTIGSIFSFSGNLDPEMVLRLARQEPSLRNILRKLERQEIAPETLAKIFDGMFHIEFLGMETVTQEFITYEYDEDFNQIEVKQTKEAEAPQFEVSLPCADTKGVEAMLSQLQQSGLLATEANGFSMKGMYDQPYYITLQDQTLLIKSNNTQTSSATISDQAPPLKAQINFKRLNKILASTAKKNGLKDFELTATKLKHAPTQLSFETKAVTDGRVEGEFVFHFDTKDRNSIVNLLLLLQTILNPKSQATPVPLA